MDNKTIDDKRFTITNRLAVVIVCAIISMTYLATMMIVKSNEGAFTESEKATFIYMIKDPGRHMTIEEKRAIIMTSIIQEQVRDDVIIIHKAIKDLENKMR